MNRLHGGLRADYFVTTYAGRHLPQAGAIKNGEAQRLRTAQNNFMWTATSEAPEIVKNNMRSCASCGDTGR